MAVHRFGTIPATRLLTPGTADLTNGCGTTRGWCGEFDDFVESVNKLLFEPIKSRRRTYTGTIRVVLDVPFRARSMADDEYRVERIMDSVSESDVLRVANDGRWRFERDGISYDDPNGEP
jgi:hypothetical protein